MKVIKYLIVSLLMFLTAVVGVSAESTDIKYNLIDALDVLPVAEYKSETPVTRAEFAYIVSAVSGINTKNHSNPGEVFYKDIPAEHEYAQYINAVSRLDIMRGFSDGLYEPEYSVTYTDAAYAFVNILGYRQDAERIGYPMGYIMKAEELGLFRYVNRNSYISQNDMNMIIYNVLTSKRRVVTSFGDDYSTYGDDSENTLLYDVFGVTEIKGIVTANAVSAIDSVNGVGEGNIKIGSEVYNAVADAQAYLGYNVVAFVQLDDDKIISISAKDTGVIKIWDEDIGENTTADAVSAYVNSKLKTYIMDDDSEYLYNGVYAQNLTRDDILIESGYIELIDNDNDNDYDILSVTEYEFAFVSYVSPVSETVVDKYGKNLRLENKSYKIFLNGTPIPITDLVEYDSISYTRSKDDDNYCIFVIRNEEFSGSVSGVSEEESVIIDAGAEYDVSPYYNELISDGKAFPLSIGLEAVYYTDIRGRIFAFEMMPATERTEQYGFLIKVAGDYEEDGVIAKMLKVDGNVATLLVAKKIRVDGNWYDEDTSFIQDIATDGNYVRRVVKYLTNGNDEICKIDTPIMGTNEVWGIDLTEDFVPENSNGTWCNADGGILDGRFYVSNRTIVFTVPDDSYRDDYTMYTVSNGLAFTNASTNYKVHGYDLDDEFIASVAVRETGGGGDIPRSAKAYMIKKFITVFDENTEEVVPGIILMDGTEILVKNKELITGLEKGDIIRFAKDAKGFVDALSLVLDSSQKKIPTSVSGSEGGGSYWIFRGEVRYGTHYLIEANSQSFIAAQLPETESDTYMFERNGVRYPVRYADNNLTRLSLFAYRYSGKVYVYDKAENEITESDMSALEDALYKNNPDARIFIDQVYGTVVRLYVIK